MAAVAVSDIQKNFGEWHDKALEEPVAISRHGRTTAYLVSSSFFDDVMANYRKSVPVDQLSPVDIELIAKATITEGEPYDLGDIPEVNGPPTQGSTRGE